ncbi:hypothetical protein ACFTXM_43380 [Streptomyces sp. NPDC056930]|uniref:hypothetical protein n=1 Tax=Streptomyces sp. NPDC056930 TaxID=3345967 RepID=UPI0036341507
MKYTSGSSVTKASSVLLTAGALAGSLLAGTGSGASADGAALGRVSVAACTNTQLVANSAQRMEPSQVRISVINQGPNPCVLSGFPTVALGPVPGSDHRFLDFPVCGSLSLVVVEDGAW